MAQITSNGRFGICDKRSDFTNVNPYNINGAFIMYVNNDDKIYYFILTSTTSTSSVTPIMSDIPGLNEFPTDGQTSMPGIRIYTDNSDQSKALNIKLYNDAQEYRNSLILKGWISNTDSAHIFPDMLILDNVIIQDTYKGGYGYLYDIVIYDNYIILEYNNDTEILKIFSDGSVTVTSTIAPDTTTPTTTSHSTTLTTTSHSTTLTTTELVTTPTTTSSTATITITPTITPIQEDIPICVNVHFNGNNYVYEDNIDDRFFVYGNRFSLTFDKYRPYSYESFDITHDDSLTNVTIGTAVDGVYIGCLYLSGDICRASNMHNIYININTATTTANKDEIDDSIDDIAPR